MIIEGVALNPFNAKTVRPRVILVSVTCSDYRGELAAKPHMVALTQFHLR